MLSSDFRVFVSGTFKDIKAIREEVYNQMQRHGICYVTMTDWPANHHVALEKSLEKLEICQGYLLIIGPRYGTCPEDSEKSLTEIEFEKAIEKKLKISVLEAKGMALTINIDDVESDALRAKRKSFIERVRQHVLPETFESELDLFRKLPAVLKQFGENNSSKRESLVFKTNDVEKVFRMADKGIRNKIDAIENLLIFAAEQFSHLFRLDITGRQLNIHPFFSELRNRLDPIVPGISLDEQNGILKRANIRHVIFRSETAITILSKLSQLNEKTLIDLGGSIGTDAANDLAASIMERPLVPDSTEALIELWNYWDGTGGWGKIELMSDNEEENIKEWQIKITNSFLTVQDAEKSKILRGFWQGYIKGFLNTSLPRIRNIAFNKLTKEERKKIRIPVFTKVKKIRASPQRESDTNVFKIEYEDRPESSGFRLLNGAKDALDNNDDCNDDGMDMALVLVNSAIKKLKDFIKMDELEQIIETIRSAEDTEEITDRYQMILEDQELKNNLCKTVIKDIIDCLEKITEYCCLKNP